MDQRKLFLILGAAVIALSTGLAAKTWLAGTAVPTVKAVAVRAMAVAPSGPRVLVAQRALPVGTIITADSVNFQEWPRSMVQDAYFVDGKGIDMNKLIGTVVRYPVTAGQPLTQGALVAPGDRGFLAAALGPGMRAITIPVSDKSAVAGFVFPGDHVDLMLTQSVAGNGQDNSGPLRVTETILKNLRVLATDQSVDNDSANGKTVVKSFHMVTLEVTPRIAEKIEVAQSVGSLDMTLRSIADNQSELDKAIATGVIKIPDGTDKTNTRQLLNQAVNAPVEGETTFATGGDVSRFQRRALPDAKSLAGHAGAGTGVKVVRGSSVSEPTEGGAGVNGATTNPMNMMANGMSRAGSTLGGTAPAGTAMGN